MSSSTAAAFALALRSSLVARYQAHGTLSHVEVHLVPPGDTSVNDVVVLIDAREKIQGQQAWAALGQLRRKDSYDIPGYIHTYATGPDTDETFQEAMDLASAILDEVILEVRDNPPVVGDQTVNAIVSRIRYEPLVNEKGGWVCRCEFVTSYEARVS